MVEIYLDVLSLFCVVISLLYLPGSKCVVLSSNGFGSGMDGCCMVL